MPGEPTLYDVLGVAQDASGAALHDAYLVLARRHHPDRDGGDAATMQAINAAWATLGDPVRRADYDRSLRRQAPGAARDTAPWADAPDVDDLADLSDLDDLDLDDRPVYATVRLPRWLSLLPATLFAAAVLLGFLGIVFVAEPVLALALLAFVLSCVFFLAAPFLALFASRRGAAVGPDAPRR